MPISVPALVLLFAAVAFGQAQRDLKLERPVPPNKAAAGGERWALIIGVSTYKHAPPHAQLKYAHRDAEDFARFLRSEAGGAVPASHMRVLTEERATLSAMRSALHEWLPNVAGPKDSVYFFIAGHGVMAQDGEGYFVAHDSDPQNLHATALKFSEVNTMLTSGLRSSQVIVLADACHAGGIGWTADPSARSRAQDALATLGNDRTVLKILASAASERSYEDERWDGGHGVFTYALLSGLRGAAEQESDGFVRVSELIDYISKVIPRETESRQNPRVAGNFEPRLVVSRTEAKPAGTGVTIQSATVDLTGPPGTSVYIDNVFRGTIRTAGDLRVDGVTTGIHRLEVEFPNGRAFEHSMTVKGSGRLDLARLPEYAVMELETKVRGGQVLEPGGAWDYFRSHKFEAEHQHAARSMMASALESIGQACVEDYVQSTAVSLKAAMLNQAAEAFTRLSELRPGDQSLEVKRTFCRGRALIAQGQFEDALPLLERSISLDPKFACAHNALATALGRLNRTDESRRSFQRAFELAPEWFLPPLQIAQSLLASGDAKRAVPLLEKAVKLNPTAPLAHWTLLKALRTLGRDEDFLAAAQDVRTRFPNYAPPYLELAAFHEARGDLRSAVQAYDAYLALAPNFGDSTTVKGRADRLRVVTNRKAPSLKR